MKLIFILLLASACAPDKPQGEAAGEINDNLNLNRTYMKEEISFACEAGCSHHYKIYLNANKLVKNAVSLNEKQLESIQNECKRFCTLDVFYRLNQEQLKLAPVESIPVAEENYTEDKPEVAPPEEKPASNSKVKSLEDL